jgi:cation:H+ antiporter
VDLTTLIFFGFGFVLLGMGAELLVRGAAEIAEILGISRLIVGLTIVAFGTSAPELAVNLQATWNGTPDIAVGNVVGSNILNILLVLGIAAVIQPISIHRQLIRLEVPLMIGASILLFVLALDGSLSRWEGLLLFSGIVLYILFTIKTVRQSGEPLSETDETTPKPHNRILHILLQLAFIVVGLGLLVLGSDWLVQGAVMIAKYYGISELIIALTVISIGTSLPELATVIVSTLKGEEELVVGNLIGSNIFNILLVLGFTVLVSPISLKVSEAAIVFDMPVMIAVALACLPIFFNGYLIERWEGGLFLAYYVAYTSYLFLNATQHSALSDFSAIMLWFVIPLTVLTLMVVMWQSVRRASAHK